MRTATSLYPVDRYLVESSNNIEMVNILEDENWFSEPALKPEDELILRKLHDMLQSTADDLKVLSGELSRHHEPGIQVKTLPTPLDEEFNEKVHIEEVVNAKFNGYKIVDRSTLFVPKVNKDVRDNNVKKIIRETNVQIPKFKTTGVQVNLNTKPSDSILKRNTNQNKTLQNKEQIKIKEENAPQFSTTKPHQAVAYQEINYNYIEPEININHMKKLHIQEMPSINIRSALKEQKVVQLDIKPKNEHNKETSQIHNTATIEIQHNIKIDPQTNSIVTPRNQYLSKQVLDINKLKGKNRKVYKMSTYESSDSTSNTNYDIEHKLKCKSSTKPSSKHAKNNVPKKSTRFQNDKVTSDTRPHFSVDEWKKKLNSVYKPTTSTSSKNPSKSTSKTSIKNTTNKPISILNNAEYIPYSKLTLGGVTIKDIEKEISDLQNGNDIPLSPILDKILTRENSLTENPRVNEKSNPAVLTTSDENLLQEVLDIEKNVNKAISGTFKMKVNDKKIETLNKLENTSERKSNDSVDVSYDDDFEDDVKSNKSKESDINILSSKTSSNLNSDDNVNEIIKNKDTTITKTSNLSFKHSVDVYEFVHSIDTKEISTQSNTTQKISLKETQTSPRSENANIQPIHNNLWPLDPKGEIEKLFNLEKDMIKKVILEEYGDLLEKNVSKPSTSKDRIEFEGERNLSVVPKNTQTSPAKVKSSMTSPKLTKTRTTSPLSLLKVHRETSPLIVVSNEENEANEISINLSSPRFSLRLPQSSRESLSNNSKERIGKNATFVKKYPKSSSSADIETSTSDLSSVGEVIWKAPRRYNRKSRITAISESSSSSTESKSSDVPSCILPLRSEGDASVKQLGKSEGEISIGQLKSEGEISLYQLLYK